MAKPVTLKTYIRAYLAESQADHYTADKGLNAITWQDAVFQRLRVDHEPLIYQFALAMLRAEISTVARSIMGSSRPTAAQAERAARTRQDPLPGLAEIEQEFYVDIENRRFALPDMTDEQLSNCINYYRHQARYAAVKADRLEAFRTEMRRRKLPATATVRDLYDAAV